MILFRLMPDGLALGLNAALCAEYRNRTIQNPEGPFDFNGEIDMTRGVDDVDTAAAPIGSGSGGGDGYAPLTFLLM